MKISRMIVLALRDTVRIYTQPEALAVELASGSLRIASATEKTMIGDHIIAETKRRGSGRLPPGSRVRYGWWFTVGDLLIETVIHSSEAKAYERTLRQRRHAHTTCDTTTN